VAAWSPDAVRVRTVHTSPRIRLIERFVTPEEAARLIELASS
jgi:hypothetical protein